MPSNALSTSTGKANIIVFDWSEDTSLIVDKVLKDSDGEKSGFNFATMNWDDNLFDKVVDPTLVEVSALENASSFVSLYFNTEVVITTVIENDPNTPNM